MPTIDNWRALREALQAGPTDGPWVMHRADCALEDGRASTHANVYKKCALHQAICGQKSNRVNGRTEQRMTDLGYIAAAHPAAIRSLLDERDRLAAEVEALRVALRFYATGEHFHLDPDEDWDSVSGEPENWLCSDREGSTTMFENGTVARMTLQGKAIDWSADGEDCTPSIVPNEAPAAAMKGKP